MIDLLKKWLSGSVNWEEEKRLRKEAETDAFLADAMEGYDQLPMVNHSDKLADLQKQLQKKHGKQQTRTIPYIGRAIAASIALLLSLGLFFLVQERIQQPAVLSEHSLQKHTSDVAMKSTGNIMEDKTVENQSAPLAAKKPLSPTFSEPSPTLQNAIASNKKTRQLKPSPKPKQSPIIPTKESISTQETTIASSIIADTKERKMASKEEQAKLKKMEQADLAIVDSPVNLNAQEPMAVEVPTQSAAIIAQPLSDTNLIKEQTQAAESARMSSTSAPIPTAPQLNSIVEASVASPIGGIKKYNQYIKKNIKHPTTNSLISMKSSVILNFSIDKEGNPIKIQVVKGLTPAYNQEAIRLIQEGPKWNSNGTLKGVYEVVFE